MKLEGHQKLVRIFVDEQDKWQGRPLYEAIIDRAWKLGMAGATAMKGIVGYGCKSHVHTAKLLDLAENLPICVEIIDTAANVAKLKPVLDEMVQEGLVTVEDVEVVIYRTEGGKKK
jgi:PII-like signaling protein